MYTAQQQVICSIPLPPSYSYKRGTGMRRTRRERTSMDHVGSSSSNYETSPQSAMPMRTSAPSPAHRTNTPPNVHRSALGLSPVFSLVNLSFWFRSWKFCGSKYHRLHFISKSEKLKCNHDPNSKQIPVSIIKDDAGILWVDDKYFLVKHFGSFHESQRRSV